MSVKRKIRIFPPILVKKASATLSPLSGTNFPARFEQKIAVFTAIWQH
jgi:hypothetical protein